MEARLVVNFTFQINIEQFLVLAATIFSFKQIEPGH